MNNDTLTKILQYIKQAEMIMTNAVSAPMAATGKDTMVMIKILDEDEISNLDENLQFARRDLEQYLGIGQQASVVGEEESSTSPTAIPTADEEDTEIPPYSAASNNFDGHQNLDT